jgi:uncharacterized protein DUF2752
MSPATRGRIATLSRAAAPLALIVFAVAVLLRFPPTEYSFYPHCPIHYFLHIDCPGCGATRALAALLHGNVAEALHLNALTTLMLPPATAYAAICYWRYLRAEPFRWPQLPSTGIYAGLTVAVLFTVFRNLPLRSL